ncbi:hypothetical protein SteCoe_7088 [Stentor coeruleus]|uniref:Uncharacterized protein n=1 Tax=Stentor coeruleus TaxID=5963 RepID=A0A1R2CNE0_9CILI|nr:hypothetical protein SteCoe_7088 [Stentor coeruleus]
MEYIFEHEKLRIDEIMRRVSVKNNFTPLKPLRSSNFNLRRNSIDTHTKTHKDSYTISLTKRSRLRVDTQSISPMFPNFLDIPGHRSHKETFSHELSKNKILHSTIPVFENSIKPLSKDKEVSKILPVISKPVGMMEKKAKDIKNDVLRKNSQSLIAYIPTVAFVNDREERNEMGEGLGENIPMMPLKSFLQATKKLF